MVGSLSADIGFAFRPGAGASVLGIEQLARL
jgi:hypothetical protein